MKTESSHLLKRGQVSKIEKLKTKLRRLYGKLSVRLLGAMCAICLPLNLLTILVAALVISKVGSEIQVSYQRELNTAMEDFEEGLYNLENNTDDFVSEYLTELMLTDESDNMVSYEMVSYLGEVLADSRSIGIIYLYDKKEEHLFVKSSQGKYDFTEIEKFKEELYAGLSDGSSEKWKCRQLAGSHFYEKYYEYENYKLGYMVDLEQNLKQVLKNAFPNEKSIFFKEKNILLELKNGKLMDDTEAHYEKLKREKLSSIQVVYKPKDFSYRLEVWISGTSTINSIPFFYWFLLILSLAFIFLLLFFWKMLQKRVVKPLEILKEGMKELEENHDTYRIGQKEVRETDDFKYLYEAFNHMAEEMKLSHEKDVKMYQVQLDNLKLQVNPHMLLNSLNMIYSLAQTKDYACIQEFSMLLVDYFRYSLKETDIFVPLRQEMKFVENYTEIQKIRFPGRFTCVYQIAEEVQNAVVPPLLIQNFVENSMKYALIPGKMIEVLINIRKEEERMLISISDTGRGIKPEVFEAIKNGEIYTDKMGRKHIGVWNCRRRMEAFYGKEAKMNILSTEGEGTQVWMELPYRELPPEVIEE